MISRSRTRFILRSAALATALLSAQVLSPSAQPRFEVWQRITRTNQRQKLTLRLSDWTPAGELASASAAVEQGIKVVWNDLTINGAFVLSGGPAATDSAGFAGLQEQAVLEVEVRSAGTGHDLRARLFTSGHNLISEKSYRSNDVQLRRACHRLADDVVFQLTGEKGVATSQIAWAQGVGSGTEIFVADYDGANSRQVTRDRNLNLSPTLSPDGRYVAFTSLRGRTYQIVLHDLSTGRDRILVGFPGMALSPSFSPDGLEVAFASNKDGNCEIYVVKTDGSSLRRITDNPAIEVQPTWSPDGKQLAYCSDRLGTPQIYVAGADGSGARRFTRDGLHDESPSWSPSGGVIAYMGRSGNEYDLYAADLAGGSTWNLSAGRGNNESPHWGANGRHVLFTSTRGGQTGLTILDTENGTLFPLPITGKVRTPVWAR